MDIEIKISDDGFQAKDRLTDIPYKGPELYLQSQTACLTHKCYGLYILILCQLHWYTLYISIMNTGNYTIFTPLSAHAVKIGPCSENGMSPIYATLGVPDAYRMGVTVTTFQLSNAEYFNMLCHSICYVVGIAPTHENSYKRNFSLDIKV